ncbi:MAG: thermonuclease family protein [Clostridiales bacterium]|nr:thermonuclease family protein [Clostridiales bacterium]
MKMKKIIVIIIALALLLSVMTACQKNGAEDNTEPTATPVNVKSPAKMPELPDMNFEGLNFFEDGYEIVEFKGLSDGDTATFVVNKLPTATRFLAIDTPEMNSSTDGQQPWAAAAKQYTLDALSNAETIILELDEESDIFDKYNRLLAWVWVDGELLNYNLVEEGLAYVKYLYGDYKYNPEMIKLESEAQKKDIKIWGQKDPDYDYEKKEQEVTLAEARALPKGSNVVIKAIVTNKIEKNAFIQDETGAIYIYANRYNYSALVPGNEITLSGKVTEYNGLLEITDVKDKKITTLSEGNTVAPIEITLDQVTEENEALYVRVTGLEIIGVENTDGEKGYNVIVKQGDVEGSVRVDKYLNPYIEEEFFSIGDTIDVVGNVGQYNEQHYVMISSEDAVTK